MGTQGELGRGPGKDDTVHAISVVYAITNTCNGKRYIGKTTNPARRWKDHKACAFRGDPRPLYCAMRKYGIDVFTFEVVASYDSEREAFEHEHTLVVEERLCDRMYGYNLTSGGRGGCIMCDDVRQRMSMAMSGSNNHMYGHRHSDETKMKISASVSGERNANFGVPKSDETKRKMSDAQRGRTFTQEHRDKLRTAKLAPTNPHRGRKRSEETKRKMREAWIKRKEKK